MWDKTISFIDALILHIILLVILFLSIEVSKKPHLLAPEKIMQAITVDESQLQVAITHQKRNEVHKMKALKAQQRDLEKNQQYLKQTVFQEQQRLEKLRHQREHELQQLANIEQQQWAEIATLEQLEQEKADAQWRLEQETLEKQRIVKSVREAEPTKRIQQVIKEIQQKVLTQWTRPVGYYKGLYCIIDIDLQPNGTVENAKIFTSSGNRIFDTSAILAVHQASPFSVPVDILDTFEHFRLKFQP